MFIDRFSKISETSRVYNVKAFGALGDGTTDDTTAIQNAINAADAAGGGVVYLPNGIYVIGGALNGTTNSQLSIPLHAYVNSVAHNKIKLLGESGPNNYSDPFTGGTPPNTGVILKSTLVGAGNVIGSFSATGPWGNFSYCHLDVENITIRVNSLSGATNIAPTATAINALNLAHLSLLNVRIDTMSIQNLSVMPANTCRGVVFPGINNFVSVNADKILIIGVYTGMELYEHANIDNVMIDMCYEGLSFNTSYHPALVNRACVARTAFNIVVKGVMPFSINQLALEDTNPDGLGAGLWYSTQFDLDERVSGTEGYIRYNKVISGVGDDNSIFTRTQYLSNIKADNIGFSSKELSFNAQTDAYTLQPTDSGSVISINSAANVALTLPLENEVPFAAGSQIRVLQLGAGQVDITSATGVIVNSAGGKYSTNAVYSIGLLIKQAINTWLLTGDVVSTGRGGNTGGGGGGSDADANAFFTAAGITDPTQQSAVTNLVIALKAHGTWALCAAIYPFVGGAASQCSFNLISPSTYQLSYGGSQVFGATGYLPDGTSSYADTGLIPSTNGLISQDSAHMSYYSLSAAVNNSSFMGGYNSADNQISQFTFNYGSRNYTSVNSNSGLTTGGVYAPITDSFAGLWLINRNNAATETLDLNGTLQQTANYVSNGTPTKSIYIGAVNGTGTPVQFTPNGCGFASIGAGFTDDQKASFASDVLTFLGALSR